MCVDMKIPLSNRYVFPAEVFLQQEGIPNWLLYKLSCQCVPQAVAIKLAMGLICQFEPVLNLFPGRVKLIDVVLIADREDVSPWLVS